MTAIWFLFKSEDNAGSRDLRKHFAELCKENDWGFVARSVRLVKDVEGRPVRILSARDLNELYRVIHREVVAVVDTCSTRVFRDPRDDGNRISSRRIQRLDRLIRYKAPLFEPPVDAEVGEAAQQVVGDFAAMVAEVDGQLIVDTDPRALPFLPFALGDRRDSDLDLDTEKGRLAFDDVHGPPRSRRDARDVLWKLNPSAYHGQDTLHIRGFGLPAGCHWDVEIERGSACLCMAAEVWQLKKGQYLNVYPDMYSRTTRRGAKRLWPKNK